MNKYEDLTLWTECVIFDLSFCLSKLNGFWNNLIIEWIMKKKIFNWIIELLITDKEEVYKCIWNISKKVPQINKIDSKTSLPIQKVPDIFTFIPTNPETDGIFSYLTKDEGKNIHDSCIIEVNTNSLFSDDFHPKNLLNFCKKIFKANRSNSIIIIFDSNKWKLT